MTTQISNGVKLSIIILNYNTGGLLVECLRGIKWSSPQLTHEIIVVDNASPDGSAAYIKRLISKEGSGFSSVRLVQNKKNLGFAAGNNIGIKAAKGEYVTVLNPDIIPLPGSFETMVNFLEKHPEAGLVAPKLLNPARTIQNSCYRYPVPMVPLFRRTFLGKLPAAKRILQEYLMTAFDHNSPNEVDWLLGACLTARRETLLKVGLFDERFFLYFEDTDLCRRMRAAGCKVIYVPTAAMVHLHQRLSATQGFFLRSLFKKTTRIHIISGIKYFWKYRRRSHRCG